MRITSVNNSISVNRISSTSNFKNLQQSQNYNADFGCEKYASLPGGNIFAIPMQPSFGSRLESFQVHKPIIKEGLASLGKERVALIIHGGSFPSTPETDTGFGNPNSTGARKLIDFASGVFTDIQFGPGGKTKSTDSSPYTGTLFSANPLFVDLEQLTTEKWDKILPKKDFNTVVANNSKRNKAETNYNYIYTTHDKALRKAYEKFIEKNTPKIRELKVEFEEYKNADRNNPWLDNDALYEALSKKHNMDYWPLWNDSLDKNLIAKKDTLEGKQRIKEIREEYANEIDYYKFVQFLYSKQIADTKEYANSKGIQFIADKQVAFSDRDTWAYQSLFLDDWSLGCPPDYFAEDGQMWGFPVLNPDKLFNPDGTLGEAGELLKKSITKIFKENDSLRIDHYLGLVDPWVYPKGQKAKAENGGGRLYSSPFNEQLKEYSIINSKNIGNRKIKAAQKRGEVWQETDYVNEKSLTKKQFKQYSRYIDKIILDGVRDAITNNGERIEKLEKVKSKAELHGDFRTAAKAQMKLDEIEQKVRNSIIAEDLGAMTSPAKLVMQKLGLNGIKVAQFMDGGSPDSPYLPTKFTNGEENYWYMAGSHDNKPLSQWAKDITDRAKEDDNSAINQIEYIADYLYKNDTNYEQYKEKLYQDPKFLMQSVYTMILKSPAKNIQIFFTDLFGDERVYNTPGTMPENNWKTRPRNNFTDQYNKALDKNMAFDFVRSTKAAIESRHLDKKATGNRKD